MKAIQSRFNRKIYKHTISLFIMTLNTPKKTRQRMLVRKRIDMHSLETEWVEMNEVSLGSFAHPNESICGSSVHSETST